MTTNTQTIARKSASSLVVMAILTILALLPASAFANAGKIIFLIGSAEVISSDGSIQAAKRGMLLDEGDTLKTTSKGQLQIRMTDGGLIAVRPNSEFRIDEFVYEKDVDTDKNFYSLIKGSFRSVTGAIGDANKSAYKVDTPVATIGIRGTDYSARLCDASCETDNGLYIGVLSGGVTLTNDAGSVDIDPAEFGYVSDMNTDPVLLEQAPGETLFSQVTGETTVVDSSSETSTESGSQTDEVIVAMTAVDNNDTTINFNNVDNNTSIQSSDTNTQLTDNLVDDSSIDLTQDNTGTGVAEETTDPAIVPDVFRHTIMVGHDKSPLASKELTDSVIYATDGKLDSFKITNTSGSVYDYARDTAIVAVDTGSTTNNEVSWGRWTNMNITLNGTTVSPSTTDEDSVHWAVTNEFEEVVLPSSGTFSYNIVGGTNPTDSNDVAVLNSGVGSLYGNPHSSLSVDFTNHSALFTAAVNMPDPEDVAYSYDWQLSYSMAIDPSTGSLSGNLSNFAKYSGGPGFVHPNYTPTAMSGTAVGTFAGFSNSGAPTAAAISYEGSTTYQQYFNDPGVDITYQIHGIVAAELQP